MTDLSEIPTSDLVTELCNRSVCSHIALMLPVDEERCFPKMWGTGNRMTQLGMLKIAMRWIEDRVDEEAQIDESGED